jgi:surfactin synthase thioesterase subunit
LVFPGGGGNIDFETTDGKVVARTAYLFSRQRDLLARPEVAVAVISAPSDQDSEFRRSARHFEDMTAVVRDLTSRYPKARLVLLGHSRGTVSAAYVAQALGARIAAVIHVFTIAIRGAALGFRSSISTR